MLFSREYLESCFERAGRWRSHSPMHGDFYIHLKHGVGVVQVGQDGEIDYSDPDVIYVPDADALLQMVESMIEGAGVDPKQSEILVAYTPTEKWHCQVRWGNVVSEAMRQESPQEALAQVLFQMDGYLYAQAKGIAKKPGT